MGIICSNKNAVNNVKAPNRPQQAQRIEHPYKQSLQTFSDNLLEDLIYNFGTPEANQNYNQQN